MNTLLLVFVVSLLALIALVLLLLLASQRGWLPGDLVGELTSWLGGDGGGTDAEPYDDPRFSPPPDDVPDARPGPSLDPDVSFSVALAAGAIMPNGRQQRLHMDESGTVTFTQTNRDRGHDDLEHSFYMGDELLREVADRVKALVARGSGSESNDYRDGDFLQVQASYGTELATRAVFNAYDDVLCPWVASLNDVLPHTMRIVYSQLLEEDRLDLNQLL